MPEVTGTCLWHCRDGTCNIDGRTCCGKGWSCGSFHEKDPDDPYPEDRPPIEDD